MLLNLELQTEDMNVCGGVFDDSESTFHFINLSSVCILTANHII